MEHWYCDSDTSSDKLYHISTAFVRPPNYVNYNHLSCNWRMYGCHHSGFWSQTPCFEPRADHVGLCGRSGTGRIQNLSVFDRRILRKIFGPTRKKDESWKIKTNMELEKLIQHWNVINYVKAQRLSRFGHVHRKPETSIVRKIYKWQPYVTRPAGRPKHRWDDNVRNDLRRMKLLKWSEQAQDRLEWKKVVEKAKTLHEL